MRQKHQNGLRPLCHLHNSLGHEQKSESRALEAHATPAHERGAKKLIAGGMGMRPLMGFNQVGIEVYFGGNSKTVGDAVALLVEGKLTQFTQEHTCGGGGGGKQF